LRDQEEPEGFDSNIIHLADSVEIAIDWDSYVLFQHEMEQKRIHKLRGDEFAPEIEDAFQEVSSAEEFWLRLASPELPSDFAEDESLVDYRCSIAEFAPISRLVRDIIDFRSTFTATHSSGVAASASVAGLLLGFSEDDRIALEIAGNLHDLGKMAVPNVILLKPGSLDEREMAVMRQHPYHTETVLARAKVPAHIVEWAGLHHERLDGSGYPHRSVAADISLGSRVMSVMDVFTALAEERPYRGAMNRESIRRVLNDTANSGALESSVVELVQDGHDKIHKAMKAAQDEAALSYRAQLAG
jgi:HD-GYP domain-containing protein (c-di-GMP phosphodiesterase class II)